MHFLGGDGAWQKCCLRPVDVTRLAFCNVSLKRVWEKFNVFNIILCETWNKTKIKAKTHPSKILHRDRMCAGRGGAITLSHAFLNYFLNWNVDWSHCYVQNNNNNNIKWECSKTTCLDDLWRKSDDDWFHSSCLLTSLQLDWSHSQTQIIKSCTFSWHVTKMESKQGQMI